MRRVVLHADDLGMSHGANAAFAELSRFGTITSGSVMVPCPWFAELAAMARDDPALDVGVHLTLTSEMQGYRWRPLTRPSAAGGADRPGRVPSSRRGDGAGPRRAGGGRGRAAGAGRGGARRRHRGHASRRSHGDRARAGIRRAPT